MVSSDGRYLLYASTGFGSQTIYLTTYPEALGRWEISQEPGASWPRWNDDMTEIYYTTHEAIMVVDCELGDGVQLGAPRKLFDRPSTRWHPSWADGFNVSGDGQRFLMIRTDPSRAPDQGGLMVVQNWYAEFDYPAGDPAPASTAPRAPSTAASSTPGAAGGHRPSPRHRKRRNSCRPD